MFALKYIAAIIAIFSTLMFISSLVADIVKAPVIESDQATKNAGFRVIHAALMSITWPLVFLL